jgi:ComF family protein
MVSQVKRFGAGLVDVLFPPRCLACQAAVSKQGTLCVECWNAWQPVEAPLCASCGLPFSIPVEDAGLQCGECLADPPPFLAARSVCHYGPIARRLVAGLKFHDRTQLAAPMAAMMARGGRELLAESDVICPVPLPFTRLFRRRYNQAALLAQEVARLSGVQYLPYGLRRNRYSAPQTGKSRRERIANLRKGFKVVRPARLAGKRVLLVDDVMTTGTTARACAKTLLKAGAREVRVLTFARTVKEEMHVSSSS